MEPKSSVRYERLDVLGRRGGGVFHVSNSMIGFFHVYSYYSIKLVAMADATDACRSPLVLVRASYTYYSIAADSRLNLEEYPQPEPTE